MRTRIIVLLSLALAAASGCQNSGGQGAPAATPTTAAPAPAAQAPAAQPAPVAAANGDQVLATVGNRTITRAEAEAAVASELAEVEAARYKIVRNGLDEMVATALMEQEAAARGVSIEELQQTEIIAKIQEPTDAEVQKLYDDNKAQLEGQSLEDVREELVEYLGNRAGQERFRAFLAELKQKYPTKVTFRPPTVDVALPGTPARGGADASVTIIEFSDYECPFCKRAEPAVQQVLSTYGDKVRFAYRHYPLPFHANARPAAEASLCANAQGKFWAFHDKAMAATDLTAASLQQIASDVGLDRAQFDECLSSGQFKGEVDKDIAAAQAAGVSGTPAFFINGRQLDGAQPFEKFQEIIDEELEAQS